MNMQKSGSPRIWFNQGFSIHYLYKLLLGQRISLLVQFFCLFVILVFDVLNERMISKEFSITNIFGVDRSAQKIFLMPNINPSIEEIKT